MQEFVIFGVSPRGDMLRARAQETVRRRAFRYAWALLLPRIYEVFPLLCPECGGELRILAFITDDSTVRDILAHLGEPTAPPRIAPALASPLWTVERLRRRSSTVCVGSFAHRRRLELRPFGSSFSQSPKVIRQWPFPSDSALLDETRERQLTKYTGHWARKSPAAG